MSGWGDFSVLMGAATAALLGLLFVAVSIRIEPIARNAELRNRAAQTLTLLLTGLLAAALLAVPDQRDWLLGVEYLILGLVVASVAVVLNRRAGERRGSTVARRVDAINPTVVTCSLLFITAVVLILGHEDGTYVLVPALIAVLAGGVVNAWLILVALND
jgi:formate-dependent nitrite reductase membrane component NrfD